jgi:hypothetical protein
VDLKKIREELNKEFEWDSSPLTLRALKKTLASFMNENVLG